jgi:hypothetical protein
MKSAFRRRISTGENSDPVGCEDRIGLIIVRIDVFDFRFRRLVVSNWLDPAQPPDRHSGKDLDPLLAIGVDKPPVADQPDRAEQSRSIIRLKNRALPCSGSRR